MLEKAQITKQGDEKAKKVGEPTIKLPLLKGGDSLENLLNELLSEQQKHLKEQAQKQDTRQNNNMSKTTHGVFGAGKNGQNNMMGDTSNTIQAQFGD